MQVYEIVIIIAAISTPIVILSKIFLDHKRFLIKQQNKPVSKEQEITGKLDQLLENVDQIYADRISIMRQAEANGETQTVESMKGQLKMIEFLKNNKELIQFAKPILEPIIKTVTRFRF